MLRPSPLLYLLLAAAVLIMLVATSATDVRGIYYPVVPFYIPLTPN